MCETFRVCINSPPCCCGTVVPGVLACVHAYIHMRVCVDVYAYICTGVHMYVYMHMRVRPCTRTCARVCMRMHVTRMRRWRVLVAAPCRVFWCLGRAYAPLYICMYVHAYMHGRVCAQPSVSVTCTLVQVFWALVHGRVYTLHRFVFTPSYTSVTHSLQVVHMYVYVYMCVYGYVCVWMRVCVYDIV